MDPIRFRGQSHGQSHDPNRTPAGQIGHHVEKVASTTKTVKFRMIPLDLDEELREEKEEK
jgi:hypothetical protein